MTPESHYFVSVEQADGRFDLERYKNSGDSTDAYYAGNATSFTDTTVPNSKWWDGSPSGLNIVNISEAGSTMTYKIKTSFSESYAVNFHTVNGNGMLTANANGKKIASGDEVLEYLDVFFTATPNGCYTVKEWKCNGEVVAGNTTNTYKLKMTYDVAEVTVEFGEMPAALIPRGGITQTSAIINWAGNANNYVVEYKTTEQTTWTEWSSHLTANTTTLTSLEPNTTYDVRVKGFCGTDIESEWSTLTFETFSNTPLFSWEIGYPNEGDIIARLYEDGTCIITGRGAMQDWDQWRTPPWNDIREQISNVIISDGINNIGYAAFRNCKNIDLVRIGKDIAIIRHWAFNNCTSLLEIYSENPTPPIVENENVFFGVKIACKVNVHEGAGCAYSKAQFWKDFSSVGYQIIITSAAGEGGRISPAGTSNVNDGCSLTFEFTPDQGYDIHQVLVNGSDVGAVVSYTFSDVTADHNIQVIFQAKQYTLSFDAQDGTVNPASITVAYDSPVGTLPTPARSNYTFGGWFTEAGGSGAEYTSATVYKMDGNTTLYAKWTVITGIEDAPARQLNIFPNPAQTEIFIKSDLQIEKVEIYSSTGVLMLLENNFSEKISISGLSQGVYMLQVYTGKEVIVSRFVKE